MFSGSFSCHALSFYPSIRENHGETSPKLQNQEGVIQSNPFGNKLTLIFPDMSLLMGENAVEPRESR